MIAKRLGAEASTENRAGQHLLVTQGRNSLLVHSNVSDRSPNFQHRRAYFRTRS